MAFPYIDTPRTEIDGNATYLTNGFRSAGRTHLSALDSVENSFHTPSKDNDVIKGFDKRVTPRAGASKARSALRHLPAGGPDKGEFTPLMKSATKNNFLKSMSAARGTDDPRTPGYQRQNYRSNAHTPGLPPMDMSDIYEEDRTMEDATPLPQAASSSAQSTPIPRLGRDSGGVLGGGQNMMSLKEQVQAIDRLQKDNWNLKLKIHYMEEQLEKAGPEYNNAALKENTELKVLRMTMQRDISRYQKSLAQAERDLEDYQVQLMEMKEKAWKRQADETVQREMDLMREELDSRDKQLREARDELRQVKDSQSQETDKLRDEIEDLEASLREKDRLLEEREEELEDLKHNGDKEGGAAAELQLELDRAKEQMQDIQDNLDQVKSEAREADAVAREAIAAKDHAEENLRELQDEMSNRSFTTKGLSRQMEERTESLEQEVHDLRQENDALSAELENKTNIATRLEERYQTMQHGLEDNAQHLVQDLDTAKRERDQARFDLTRTSARLEEALNEIQRATDEKELLQTRHRALTDESGGLQAELDRAQSRIRELQKAVQDATTRAQDEGHNTRWQHKVEVERLQEEIENLQHEIEEKEGRFAVDQSRWESNKRTLLSEKSWAEDQAADLKRTIDRLQEAGNSYSGKESRLQEAFDAEKKRNAQEMTVLNRQIQDLKDDLGKTRRDLDEKQDELLAAKQDVRVSRREEQALQDKVRALEDEVVVLQSSLADEQELAKGRQNNTPELEKIMEKTIAERQKLRDELANAHVELYDLKSSAEEMEAERAELHAQLERLQNADDTTRFDRDKLELRKTTTRLENELNALRDAKATLENQLISESERFAEEEGRFSAEIDRLQDKLLAGSGNRDRELTTAKTKVQRLERRVQELEAMIEQPPMVDNEQSGAHGELSLLRHSLDEARKREKILLQRESKQKSSAQSHKSRIEELEKDLHEAMMNKFDSNSPHNSPSNKLHDELRTLRKQVAEAHRSLQKATAKNRELERAAMKEEDQKDFHELLRSSTLEAESLALKLSEREGRLNELKKHVLRIREERDAHRREAEAATNNLNALQQRHEEILAKNTHLKSSNKTKHEKEMRGLGKEIIWLRARLQREEKFRRDLAWSKGLMELGERVRVACNDADLRMISEMGVQARDRTPTRTPRHKFRTAISLVRATVRMQKMSSDWKRTKKLGEGLKRAKSEMLKRRDGSNKSLLGQ